MKVLLLSCSTGEGHNHCALAVKEALDERGHKTEFLDMLHFFGDAKALNIESVLNSISARTPEMFGLMYKAGAMYSATKITSPVYLANSLHAKQLFSFLTQNRFDAIVCSHLFPMETLTFIRKHYGMPARCYGVLSDYACIPFFAETLMDTYCIAHASVRDECIGCGMPADELVVTGMPVHSVFRQTLSKAQARKQLGLPAQKKIYLIMTGGIGCGDAIGLCDAIRRIPDPRSLLCVLAGRNQELLSRIQNTYESGSNVLGVPFTDQVAVYMRASDVLLTKAGGISSSEAAVLNVPMVHTMMIPGVETQNAAFFAREGMSFCAKNADEAARCADRLIYDSYTAQHMLAAQRDNVPVDGAMRIVQRMEEEYRG